MKGYRFVKENLKSEHGDIQWAPGEWQKREGKLSLCENGLHASQKPLDSLNYVFGTRWFECEARGKILKDTDKFCASEMRLLQEIPKDVLIQFAIECARKALPIFERQYYDKRPRKAIRVAQAYLKNPSDAAHAATRAASDAAYAASDAAYAAGDAVYAASAAARTAAYAASAASDAASAARAVSYAASAARDAAYAASAASDAASAAMKHWQNKHLLNLIRKTVVKEINE